MWDVLISDLAAQALDLSPWETMFPFASSLLRYFMLNLIRQSSGSHQAVIRQSSGSHQAVIRQSLDTLQILVG